MARAWRMTSPGGGQWGEDRGNPGQPGQDAPDRTEDLNGADELDRCGTEVLGPGQAVDELDFRAGDLVRAGEELGGSEEGGDDPDGDIHACGSPWMVGRWGQLLIAGARLR
jgi:hypothetical protein